VNSNDTHGHQVGDQVLSAISQVLQTHVRATDIAGRWGGEEFMVICPETNEEGALKLAEHLRSTIAAHEFPVVKAKTASFGIAVYQTGDSIHTLVARADTALYHAKHAGRNLVRML
jgi:diguanylate cyclase (GGDEF)-like protein